MTFWRPYYECTLICVVGAWTILDIPICISKCSLKCIVVLSSMLKAVFLLRVHPSMHYYTQACTLTWDNAWNDYFGFELNTTKGWEKRICLASTLICVVGPLSILRTSIRVSKCTQECIALVLLQAVEKREIFLQALWYAWGAFRRFSLSLFAFQSASRSFFISSWVGFIWMYNMFVVGLICLFKNPLQVFTFFSLFFAQYVSAVSPKFLYYSNGKF